MAKASEASEQRIGQARSGLVDAFVQALPRLRRMGARHQLDGDDFAQEACMRLLRVGAPEAVAEPAQYVASVARNLLIDRHRTRAREAVVLAHDADLRGAADPTADPEQILAGKQQLARILAAIDALPPRCSEAFCLHRFDGLTYVAIARRMGISTSAVEKHISDALRRLDLVLSQENDDV